jgi:lipopolysaccharide export system protein LptA
MRRLAILIAVVLLPLVSPATAQGVFSQAPIAPGAATATAPRSAQADNRDAPVQIEAATLEVHDKSKTATFSGSVQVVQGDTTMKCRSLVVFYGQEVGLGDSAGEATATVKTPLGAPKGAQNIRRIEARGGVTVITKDQSASGDLGVYDLKSKTITLSGNVVVSQGQNVIHGERVVVDTETGNARVESGGSGAVAGAAGSGRVRALIQPGKGQGGPSNFMTIGPGRPN